MEEKIEYTDTINYVVTTQPDLVAGYIDELNERIAELEQELAELKEKAIIPRFEYGDKVYYIRFFWGEWRVFNQKYVAENRYNIIVRAMNYYNELPKDSVFATAQEAHAKLKEIQGE